jgi:hypothetical protein
MPSADQIRTSLGVRIEQLEGELRQLRAAHTALTAADPDGIPPSVLRVFKDWDAGGRPAQKAAVWQRDRWLAAMPRQARVLEALPDRLDRLTVRQLVQEKPLTAHGMFEAMVIVYAWGWSMTSVGVTRAQTALGAGARPLGSALLAARDAVRTRGPLAGYAALAGPRRVAGLGPSFGSKFLYFVSPEGRRALMLDRLLAAWLDREAALSLNATRWSSTTYGTYLTTMQVWSSRLGIADHELEEILFTDEATRRGLGPWRRR